MADIALQVQRQLREEMVRLRSPAEPEAEPLVSQLRTTLRSFEQQWFIPVAFDVAEPASIPELPARVGRQLLRLVQEALSNTRLHAGATAVVVRLSRRGTRLRLEVEDDGRGFDLASVPPSRLGLRIMQERIEQVGGHLEIDSGAGTGTRVCADVPVSVGGPRGA